ncbi:MAG TPA: ABC-type transport auxiliary lipoprotein family protein [Rhodanobacteraceae bacterium]|nr:ABC-type transport auxiliary lipoprotein family protein [Rhodanobacteraceae bacterium]
MKRMRAMFALSLLALGGCATASRQGVVPRHYVLDGSAPASSTTAPHPRGTVLRLARIEVPAWLQGTGLYYRLAYRDDDVVAAYADSDWAAPPAGMLAQRLRNVLAGGGWRAVIGPAGNARAGFTLHVQLQDFSQVFTTPAQSYGVLAATATLVDAHAAVVAQRQFRLRVVAPSADAAGGVQALDAASRDFARQLRDWLAAQQPTHS